MVNFPIIRYESLATAHQRVVDCGELLNTSVKMLSKTLSEAKGPAKRLVYAVEI